MFRSSSAAASRLLHHPPEAVSPSVHCAAIHAFRAPLLRNVRLAQAAVSHVRGLLWHGSTALPDARLTVSQANALHFTHKNELHRRVCEAARKREIHAIECRDAGALPKLRLRASDVARIRSDLLIEWGHGTCMDLACAAYTDLITRVPPGTLVDLCHLEGGDHALVVIGRKPGSDPKDATSWGPHAVVCDPWAHAAYPLVQLNDMRRPEHNVERHVGCTSRHYLAGELQVQDEYLEVPLYSLSVVEQRPPRGRFSGNPANRTGAPRASELTV